MEFVLHTSGGQPIGKHFFQMERHLYDKEVVSCIQKQIIVWAEKSYSSIFWLKEDVERLYKESERFLDPVYAKKVLRECEAKANIFWKTAKDTLGSIGHGIERYELAKRYDLYQKALREVYLYFLVTGDKMTYAIERELRQIVESRANLPPDAFAVLTTPAKPDLLHLELSDWKEVVKNPTEEAILNHAMKYPILLPNTYDEKAALEWARKRMKDKGIEEIARELKESVKKKRELARKKKELVNQPGLNHALKLGLFIREGALIRLKLKACWNGESFLMLPMYRKIAEIAKCDVETLCLYYIPREISDLLHNGHKPRLRAFEARKNQYLLHLDGNVIRLYTGNMALAMKGKLLSGSLPDAETTEFNGSVACKGKVTGKVRLVKTDNPAGFAEIAKSLDSESILVTGMTNPAMMVLIKKVKGIVTDEGGIASHAAIISREMNIPCIVGTKIATHVLKDGDFVEVDAEKGIVRKIKPI